MDIVNNTGHTNTNFVTPQFDTTSPFHHTPNLLSVDTINTLPHHGPSILLTSSEGVFKLNVIACDTSSSLALFNGKSNNKSA